METGDKLSPAEVAKETTNSLHTYELDDETLEKAKTESKKIFVASQSRPSPTTPPLLTEEPTEDDQPPSTIDLFPPKRSL